MDEDDWEEILSMSKPLRGYKASTRSKNKDSAQVSDSDDEDYDPSTKAKTIPKVRKKVRWKTMSRLLIQYTSHLTVNEINLEQYV